MRYVVLPEGETGDFVMLSPANLDQDPARLLTREELDRLGRAASRTEQPAVLSLVRPDVNDAHFPGVILDDAGTCVVQVRLHVNLGKPDLSQDLVLAMVVVTPKDESGGS